jgi:hypothetical protein
MPYILERILPLSIRDVQTLLDGANLKS